MSAFRGSNIKVQRILLQGRQVVCDIAFVDDEGIVHATTKHSFTDVPSEISGPAAELVRAIGDYANQIHFGDTSRKERARATGIAESFHSTPDPAENPEGQG